MWVAQGQGLLNFWMDVLDKHAFIDVRHSLLKDTAIQILKPEDELSEWSVCTFIFK